MAQTPQTGTKLPIFKGNPLIEIPASIPQAGFLKGDFGKAFLEEYQGRVKADYNGNSNLNVLSYRGGLGLEPLSINVLTYSDGVVEGSNPFAVVLANQILRQEGLRTATQSDLEKALRIGWDLRGTYKDTALVLRSGDEPNKYLASNLMKQVKARNPLQTMPVMIPLNGLELRTDQSSHYGLAFDLTDLSEIIYALILDEPEKFNSEDINEETGLPRRTGKGNRTLCPTDSGLSRLDLDHNLDLNSDHRGLADSDEDGRVVVVKPGEN